MIVLNRKRIVLVLSSVFLSILVFMFSFENGVGKNDYISTVSLPVSGKTIVIDSGHRCSRWTVQNLAMERQRRKPI